VTTFSVPRAGVDAIAREVASYGSAGLETGGFLLAPTGGAEVHAIALAGTSGIVRRHNLFQISASALDRLFAYADESGFWLPAQFHSHQVGALLSLPDALHGVRAEGFVSVIVPNFACPPEDPMTWGWWQFTGGDWGPSLPAAVSDEILSVVVEFDEDGVRDR
jgi:hypothetical protein